MSPQFPKHLLADEPHAVALEHLLAPSNHFVCGQAALAGGLSGPPVEVERDAGHTQDGEVLEDHLGQQLALVWYATTSTVVIPRQRAKKRDEMQSLAKAAENAKLLSELVF